MIDYKGQLDDQQFAAATHAEGPAIVASGPGSGKTRVITYRTARLIDGGLDPHRLLVCTFTRSAAKELRTRAIDLVGKRASGIVSGTFHAFCARLLKKAPFDDRSPSYGILDADDALSMWTAIFGKVVAERHGQEAIKKYKEKNKPKDWKDRMDRFREQGLTPDYLPDESDDREMWTRYEKRLRELDLHDFSSLLVSGCAMVRQNPEWQRRFSFVMVDEFQDTNDVQFELAKALAGSRNLFASGDVDQSLYAWRGATPANMVDFAKIYPDAKTYVVESNYRSTGRIVSVCQRIIEKNKMRIEKTMRATGPLGAKIAIVPFNGEFAQGTDVCQWVQIQLSCGVLPREIAVLYRTKRQSREPEIALVRGGVAYQVLGGHRFYDRREVRDFVSYLRCAAHDENDEAFKRALRAPKKGVGDATINVIGARAAARGTSMYDVARSIVRGDEDLKPQLKSSLSGVRHTIGLINECRQMVEERPLSEAVDWLLEKSGLIQFYEELDKEESKAKEEKEEEEAKGKSWRRPREKSEAESVVDGTRVDNLHEIVSAVRSYEQRAREGGEIPSLDGYLEEVDLSDRADDERSVNKVSLMTIHASKGREFDHVRVIGCDDGRMPLIKPSTDFEEERRIMYVACSRARKSLTISCSGEVRGKPAMPSRYLAELPDDDVEWTRQIYGWRPPVARPAPP